MPSVSVCFSTRRIRPWRASMRSSPPKITSSAVGAQCTTHDVVDVLGQVAQHAHHRGDAAARGEEQDLGWRRAREGEFACGLVELDDGADGGVSDQVIADLAVRDGLDGDRDAPSARPVSEVSE